MKLLLIHPDLSLIRSLVLEFGGNMEISQISCLNLEDVGKTILQNPDIRAVAIKLTHANEKQVFSVISQSKRRITQLWAMTSSAASMISLLK
jgi:hypothetical protein